MAKIIPFRGELYNPEKIHHFEQVVAPPYDVISDDQLQQLRERSPHNIVHLLLAPRHPDDTDEDNRYTRTAKLLDHWRWMEVLKRDASPALYLYEQTFEVHDLDETTRHTRRSLLVRIQLEPLGQGVFPHEKTLAAPKEDRLRLLRACHTNLSPVFGLYSEPEDRTDALLKSALRQEPLIDIQVAPNRRERLWRLAEPALIEPIQTLLEPLPIVIADGHHRYETALFYHEECQARGEACEGSRYILMALTRMESPGLVVLPIHRLLHELPESQIEQGWNCLRRFFLVEPADSATGLIHTLHHMDGTAFGIHCPSHGHALLRLREDVDITPYLDPTHSEVYNRLDVTRLHAVALKGCFKVDTSVVEQQRHVSYTEDTEEAIRRVESGRSQLAFFLNPTRVDQVRDVAMEGETMPQKSTFFFPKLTTGFVLNPLD